MGNLIKIECLYFVEDLITVLIMRRLRLLKDISRPLSNQTEVYYIIGRDEGESDVDMTEKVDCRPWSVCGGIRWRSYTPQVLAT